MRLAEVDDYRHDEARLCKECMMHECSGYCMRNYKGRKNAKRYCRAGTGDEATPNMNDTPGFDIIDEPRITVDHRGFFKLEMERNSLRLVQAPLHVLRGWRGNCDFKILLYGSTNGTPDPEEISRVTDYLVSYETKGNARIKEEVELVRDYILE